MFIVINKIKVKFYYKINNVIKVQTHIFLSTIDDS